jgi:LuxR family transcriptional regulator, activator of conjugal transfer of Ti plasmids
MLRSINFKGGAIDYQGYVPPLFQPLMDAASASHDLVPVINRITAAFGFDTFNCSVSMCMYPQSESLAYVFTTMPAAWVALYDQRSFVEVDPRVQWLISTQLPMIWDQASLRGSNPKVDEFLDAGLKYGLGSGVVVGFADVRGHGVMFALNSAQTTMSAARKNAVSQQMGEIILLAHFFHEIFAAEIIKSGSTPTGSGAPLSSRERQCLSLAAHGQTSQDIAGKLGITERTVEFHFVSIRSKLAAATRQEAVAKAVQAGLVTAVH